jgi:hypothetical protein
MEDQNNFEIHKTPNLCSQLRSSPPPVLLKYPQKMCSKTSLVTSPSNKAHSYTKNNKEFSSLSFHKTFFPISDLDRMQKDFMDSPNQVLIPSESAKTTGFFTPKKPPLTLFTKELKIEYEKDDPNRTSITPFSPLVKSKNSTNPRINLPDLFESSGQEIRLHIPPSYHFESQISNITPFELGRETQKKEGIAQPASITVNHNIISSQPKDLELNLNEVDAMSFEATGEINNIVLNPNDITGTLKPFFPLKKSGKISKKLRQREKRISFLRNISQENQHDGFGQCSCVCKCGLLSRKSKLKEKGSYLNFSRPFGSNHHKSKYISNRMKFEKQGQKNRSRKRKCLCLSLRQSHLKVSDKKSFVSEFFDNDKSKNQPKPSSAFNFSNLHFDSLKIKKEEIFLINFKNKS